MKNLIGPDEPEPVSVERPDGKSPFLLIGDHAGNLVPRSLNKLGLPPEELDRHIGIDIGISGVGRGLASALDATFIHQRYSRLVIDCNRPSDRPDAMAVVSDGTAIPGNHNLSEAERAARVREIFEPYHARITNEIQARIVRGTSPILIALHSFTAQHGDFPRPRPWDIGVLWNRDNRLAAPLITALQAEGDLVVGVNQPYGVSDDIDYAIPVHAEARGLVHVELEIRQDLIADMAGQADWVKRLTRLLPIAAGPYLRREDL